MVHVVVSGALVVLTVPCFMKEPESPESQLEVTVTSLEQLFNAKEPELITCVNLYGESYIYVQFLSLY